jgi:hypothetical protein
MKKKRQLLLLPNFQPELMTDGRMKTSGTKSSVAVIMRTREIGDELFSSSDPHQVPESQLMMMYGVCVLGIEADHH